MFSGVLAFSQTNEIVKSEDGRRILLKADYTWEYIDIAPKEDLKPTKTEVFKTIGCTTESDFSEPKLNGKIQARLRKGRATVKHIKKRIAKAYGSESKNVLLLSAKETREKGNYEFCLNGEIIKYKRVGNTLIQKNKKRK